MSKLNWEKRVCTVVFLCATTAIALPGQTLKTLHSFAGADGINPDVALIQATDGDFYGTTYLGGSHNSGTIFKIDRAGTLKTIYDFCQQSGCTDGDRPQGGLVQAPDGNFYGTTEFGGTDSRGRVFKITRGGALTILYNFCSLTSCADGYYPVAGLVRATDGNFYGTTRVGGAQGAGTVFKINASGALTTLYSFCSQSGCTDGSNPYSGLIQATDGNFYGTTSAGASSHPGTIFMITSGGALTTLYSFCPQSGCTDGAKPIGGLVQAADGNFYGTTYNGGANGPHGTIYEITPSGTLTTLYSFCSQSTCTDGEHPESTLVQATDGSLYGTTYVGGAYGWGTIFRIPLGGTLKTLHSFSNHRVTNPDGANPFAGLLQATTGNFYGTTSAGGVGSSYGEVYSLSVGLGPFVETQTTSGKVGAAVKILGTNLTGATSVSFNGTPAVFTVVSGSLITTNVPAGATTGTVEVVTPDGTLSSNVPFRVRP